MIGGQDRLTGYREVLRDSDRRSIIAVGDFTRESGAVAMRQLLADDPDIDAVFAANDLMAHRRACTRSARPAAGSRTTSPSSATTTSRPPATPTRR